jgi:putative oxidoreductase
MIQHPFQWMGPEAHVPGIFQALAALSEFGGGLAWILGLLTPLASLGLLFTMAYAVYFHLSHGDPFVSMSPGGMAYQPALLFASIALLLILGGPGQFSLDAVLCRKKTA